MPDAPIYLDFNASTPIAPEMGAPPREGMGAVRFSLGRPTTWEQLDRVLARVAPRGA